MAGWETYKGIEVPEGPFSPEDNAGEKLKDDLTLLTDRAPNLATTDPTANDDSSADFAVGSRWLNTTDLSMWICTDASVASAVWKPLARWDTSTDDLNFDSDVGVDGDVHRIATGADASLVLKPKGDGALQGDDGGNARGSDAVDWQMSRTTDTEVASGNNSTIGGGENNTASGTQSTVGGGEGNVASSSRATVGGGQGNTAESASYCTIGGGLDNNASGAGATIAGGRDNTATADRSTIGGGDGNSTNSSWSTVGGGSSNTCSAVHATVAGGESNTASGSRAAIGGGSGNAASGSRAAIAGGRQSLASGDYSSVTGGYFADASLYGQHAHAAGRFGEIGDAQTCRYVARTTTSNATATELFLDGASARLQLSQQDRAWAFEILVIARRSDADNETAAWKVSGCIDRNGSTTALVGTPSKVTLGDDSGGTWDVTVDADNSNNSLRIRGTGESGKTIRWLARIVTIEIEA